MLDFAPTRDKRLLFSVAFQEVVDRAMQAHQATIPPRDYLGGSRLGEECARKLAYEYRGTPKDKPFEGKILRVFDRGHDAETRMAAYLRRTGFNLLTERPDGEQFGFWILRDKDTGRARIAGHIDGVIVGGPPTILHEPISYPCLWENKCINNKNFQKLVTQGLQKAKPIYYGQMQCYMGYLDLFEHPGLFTATNADTQEIYAELVPYDRYHAQTLSDRGLQVVMAESPESLPRIAREATDFRCKFCDFAKRCWDAPAPQAAPTAPAGWGR